MPMNTTSPVSDTGKRTASSSPRSRNGSPTNSRGATTGAPSTPSFFIIQEPNHQAVIQPAPTLPTAAAASKVTAAPSPNRGDLDRQRGALSSRQSVEHDHSLNSGSPGPRVRHRGRTSFSTGNDATALQEETEDDLLGDDEEREPPPARKARTTLSILNRCGSSPDLPLHNSYSSLVFSSSKKRQLMKTTNGLGTSPHLAVMQRSRLIPLPINIRTGTLQKPTKGDNDFEAESNNRVGMPLAARSSSLGSLRELPPVTPIEGRDRDAQEEKMNYQISIASLKQRLLHMEKEFSKATKNRHILQKQVDQTTKENHALQAENTQLVKKLDDLDKANMHQRHAFDKLSEKYATVYSNLAKISDGAAGDKQSGSATSVQLVIQTLTRENQELQRKVRVLEERHADDKVILRNQEQQIKRLRAEMEALQHMAGSNKTFEEKTVAPTTTTTNRAQQYQETSGSTSKGGPIHHNDSMGAIRASPPAAVVTATPAGGGGGGVQGDEYAYIDPNILKVLEKVDSQFSITNAIALASVLKKWLHSCLHIVASTDLHGVLHVLLKRVCELLHCHHAAIFHVDHSGKKLVGLASERGQVRWEMPLDKGILGTAARQNILCNVRKAYDDPRFFSSSDTITGTKSREVLCIPLTRELENGQMGQLSTATTAVNPSVFAVLQCWNTTTQKPFSPNDQILGGLLAIQAGVVLSQTRLTDKMQYINNRVLQLVHMNDALAAKAAAAPPRASGPQGEPLTEIASSVSIVHLVKAAQRKFAEIVGITKLRIFILDADVMRVWHVGAQLDAGSSSSDVQLVPIRKYANVHSSLCALLLSGSGGGGGDDATASSLSTPSVSSCQILLDPTAQPTFNDTVDLKGGANGLYLAPIRSPWRELPLGMIQVARTGSSLQSSLFSADAGPVSVAMKKEKDQHQQTEDALTIELIELFCRQFASLLHHAMALQLHETCPREVQEARLAYLTDRLDALESEYLREQEEAEAEADAMARHSSANVRLEEKLLQSVLQGERRTSTSTTSRPTSAIRAPATARHEERLILEPVPLISTDSTYAIDVSELGELKSESPATTTGSGEEGSSSSRGETSSSTGQDDQEGERDSPTDSLSF